MLDIRKTKKILYFYYKPDNNITISEIVNLSAKFDKIKNKIRESQIKNLLINLENIELIDSVGIGFLISLFEIQRRKNGKTIFCNVCLSIESFFSRMRMDVLFDYQSFNVQSAIEKLEKQDNNNND